MPAKKSDKFIKYAIFFILVVFLLSWGVGILNNSPDRWIDMIMTFLILMWMDVRKVLETCNDRRRL
jgi:magnesium-transporting ATPase (P-type)